MSPSTTQEPFAVLTPKGLIHTRCWTLQEAEDLADYLETKAGVTLGSMFLVVSTRGQKLNEYTDQR